MSGLERLNQVISDIVLNIVGASQYVLGRVTVGKHLVVSREIDLEQLTIDLMPNRWPVS